MSEEDEDVSENKSQGLIFSALVTTPPLDCTIYRGAQIGFQDIVMLEPVLTY